MDSFNQRKSRKERQDASAFSTLIATPAPGFFRMPAKGRLKIVSLLGCIAGSTMATITGSSIRTIKSPLLTVGGYLILDNVDASAIVDPPANFDVYVDIGLNVFRKVCTG